jgi:hypothetical protein
VLGVVTGVWLDTGVVWPMARKHARRGSQRLVGSGRRLWMPSRSGQVPIHKWLVRAATAKEGVNGR